MRYLNVVHLSDLHQKTDGLDSRNQIRILDRLADDLTHLSTTHLKPDLIVFSGDLANAGDAASYNAIRSILYKILEVCSLPPERLLIAPGNHDAIRGVVETSQHDLISWRNLASQFDGANKLAYEPKFIGYVSKKFEGFNKLQATFGPKPVAENAFYRTFYFEALMMGFVVINTALLSGAGLCESLHDEGQLAFPDLMLEEAISSLPKGSTIFVVGHHPVQYFNEGNAAAIKTVLCGRATAYTFGHMHNASPEHVESAAGQCKFLQSGALFMGRGRWNGYHVASVVPGNDHIRVTTRRWHEGRLEFGVSSDLSDDGVLFLPSAARETWRQIPDRPNYALLEDWRETELLATLNRECNQSLSDLPLADIFVEPEFEKDVFVTTVSGEEPRTEPQSISFQELDEGVDNLIVAARSETGKTALARHWAREMAKRSAYTPGWRIPVLINYSQVRAYVGGVEQLVSSRIADLPSGLRARSLLKAGLVTIFIDDMRLEETQEKQALCEFIDTYPDCRYVMFTSSQFLQSPGISPKISPSVHFNVVRIRRLRKSQLLSLIEKHGTSDPAKADRLLDRLLVEANNLSVPLTAVSSTFLIRIFTERSAKPVINRAALLERYIEINLEKYAQDEILSSTFDFHNKSDLLSDIAEKMCRDEIYEWSERQALDSIQEYLDRYDLNYSAVSLLKYFESARIFETVDEKVGFRLKAFLEYFAAKRMVDEPSFRAWVLDDIRYLQFEGEISCYAALTRRDGALIKELMQRYEDKADIVWKESAPGVRDGSILENIELPSAGSSEDDVFKLEERVMKAPLGEEGRRELLNSSTTPEQMNGRTVNRPVYDGPGEEWTTQLNVLSAMARHMELIPKDQKQELLDRVIKGWVSVLSMSIGIAPAIAQQRAITFNGIKYEIQFPEDMSLGEITRRMLLSMPIGILRLIHQVMGTDKLSNQLAQGLGTSKIPLREQVVRVGLLSLLGNDGISEELQKVADALKGNDYLSEVLLRQLYDLAIRYRLPEHEIDQIRRIAADVYVELEKTPASKRRSRRDEMIERLKKSRLVVGVDPKAEIEMSLRR